MEEALDTLRAATSAARQLAEQHPYVSSAHRYFVLECLEGVRALRAAIESSDSDSRSAHLEAASHAIHQAWYRQGQIQKQGGR